jgi:hypothetical protein
VDIDTNINIDSNARTAPAALGGGGGVTYRSPFPMTC